MSQLLLSGLLWAFSFWLVADALRRQSNPLWVVLILLVQPYGGLAYLVYLKWRTYRRVRAAAFPCFPAPRLYGRAANEPRDRSSHDRHDEMPDLQFRARLSGPRSLGLPGMRS